MRNGTILLVMTLLVCWATASRSQVATGTISGTATDNTGAVLPGAKIEIENNATGATGTEITDSTGHFSAPSLAVGNYKITASMQGFQDEVVSGIDLAVASRDVN